MCFDNEQDRNMTHPTLKQIYRMGDEGSANEPVKKEVWRNAKIVCGSKGFVGEHGLCPIDCLPESERKRSTDYAMQCPSGMTGRNPFFANSSPGSKWSATTLPFVPSTFKGKPDTWKKRVNMYFKDPQTKGVMMDCMRDYDRALPMALHHVIASNIIQPADYKIRYSDEANAWFFDQKEPQLAIALRGVLHQHSPELRDLTSRMAEAVERCDPHEILAPLSDPTLLRIMLSLSADAWSSLSFGAHTAVGVSAPEEWSVGWEVLLLMLRGVEVFESLSHMLQTGRCPDSTWNWDRVKALVGLYTGLTEMGERVLFITDPSDRDPDDEMTMLMYASLVMLAIRIAESGGIQPEKVPIDHRSTVAHLFDLVSQASLIRTTVAVTDNHDSNRIEERLSKWKVWSKGTAVDELRKRHQWQETTVGHDESEETIRSAYLKELPRREEALLPTAVLAIARPMMHIDMMFNMPERVGFQG